MDRQRTLQTFVVVSLMAIPLGLRAQPTAPPNPAPAPPADVPPTAAQPAAPPTPPPNEPSAAPPPAPTPPPTSEAPAAPPPAAPSPAAPPPDTTTPAVPEAVPTLVPPGPLQIGDPKGTSIKFGLLLQPQFQAAGSTTVDGTAVNLFIRRTRFIVGGTLFGVFDYFFDTDFANLDLASNVPPAMMGGPNTTTKNTPGLNIQDAFLTYRPFGDVFKVDAGYMLPPMSHNAVQGAGTLYSWDYFTYTFRHSDQFTIPPTTPSPVGRDAGLQLRGLVLGNHLEYRVGLFQGLRDVRTTELESRNFFRFMGRLQINILDPETGFFYAGTYLGTKKVVSVGGSFDVQGDYKYFSGDGFVDLPVGPGVVTAQVDVSHWDGGTFVAMPNQTALSAELGFHFKAVHLAPILRGEHLWITGATPDQTRLGGGLALFAYAHNFNLKAFYQNIKDEGVDQHANQFNLQAQLYFF